MRPPSAVLFVSSSVMDTALQVQHWLFLRWMPNHHKCHVEPPLYMYTLRVSLLLCLQKGDFSRLKKQWSTSVLHKEEGLIIDVSDF